MGIQHYPSYLNKGIVLYSVVKVCVTTELNTVSNNMQLAAEY